MMMSFAFSSHFQLDVKTQKKEIEIRRYQTGGGIHGISHAVFLWSKAQHSLWIANHSSVTLECAVYTDCIRDTMRLQPVRCSFIRGSLFQIKAARSSEFCVTSLSEIPGRFSIHEIRRTILEDSANRIGPVHFWNRPSHWIVGNFKIRKYRRICHFRCHCLFCCFCCCLFLVIKADLQPPLYYKYVPYTAFRRFLFSVVVYVAFRVSISRWIVFVSNNLWKNIRRRVFVALLGNGGSKRWECPAYCVLRASDEGQRPSSEIKKNISVPSRRAGNGSWSKNAKIWALFDKSKPRTSSEKHALRFYYRSDLSRGSSDKAVSHCWAVSCKSDLTSMPVWGRSLVSGYFCQWSFLSAFSQIRPFSMVFSSFRTSVSSLLMVFSARSNSW